MVPPASPDGMAELLAAARLVSLDEIGWRAGRRRGGRRPRRALGR
jgi:hypothetical protein